MSNTKSSSDKTPNKSSGKPSGKTPRKSGAKAGGNTPQEPSDDIQFFAKQKRIYPRRVSGFYRNLKWAAMIICLAIYYLVPFIRWDRGPNAPDQAVLIDLEARRAYWFWIEIWPQEVYILTGILILAAIGLFFITSLFGRVWCGYLCFQTVWTDLFIWVERIIQGDRYKRQRLREGPWTWEKIYKLAITHALWLAIAWCTAGSFVLYFNDAPSLVYDFLTFDVSKTVLGFVIGLTFMTYLMAGFAREQVCTFMCPYARFQSAMFDKDTLVIGYDAHRGEPRGKHKKGEDWSGLGDCVDCTACVQVCPMGIDIRDGLQMECIACGLCIDACDEIMDKVGLERGLIRYDTDERLESKTAEKVTWRHFIRPRTIYYASVMLIVGGIMIYALATRSLTELHVLHDRNPLFVTMSNGDIRNGYDIKILNKTYVEQHYELEVKGLENAVVEIRSAGSRDASDLIVAPDSVEHYKVQIRADVQPQEPLDIQIILRDIDGEYEEVVDTKFVTRRARR